MKTKKKILFVCVENSCRSQMAEGFANHFSKGGFKAYSAGSGPSGKINETAIAVMQEAGIDISPQKSKGFEDLGDAKFDYVVSMGCQDICPFVPAKKHLEWRVDDPKGKNLVFFRSVRDQIAAQVLDLIHRELKSPDGGTPIKNLIK